MSFQQGTIDFKKEISTLGIEVNLSDAVLQSLSEVDGELIVLMNQPTGFDESISADILNQFQSHLSRFKSDSSAFIPESKDASGWDISSLSAAIVSASAVAIIHAEPDQHAQALTLTLAGILDSGAISMMHKRADLSAVLYARCMMTPDRSEPLQSRTMHSEFPAPEPASNEVLTELAALESAHPEMMLFSNNHVKLYLFQGTQAPHLLHEIGVGREITFKVIGAGSGNEVDLSDEDLYYYHLTLWDKENQCLAGAYRVGFTDDIIASHGREGLYLDHIFDIEESFYKEMGNAMELSRSFILPQYQKKPQMLDALWKGLGLTAQAKKCFTMYGSVTISSAFTPLSKAILVDMLGSHHADIPSLSDAVTSKIPFQPTTAHHKLTADAWSGLGLNKLNSLIEEIEEGQRNIPPLVRYYVALGAKFLAFHVEPSFNDAIYCLLRVDLNALPARYKKRFFGESG